MQKARRQTSEGAGQDNLTCCWMCCSSKVSCAAQDNKIRRRWRECRFSIGTTLSNDFIINQVSATDYLCRPSKRSDCDQQNLVVHGGVRHKRLLSGADIQG